MSSAQDKDELWLDDDIIELDDDEAVVTKAINPWQVLIVDDEPDIHHATRLALSNIQYKSRPLELLNAYSGAEAARMLLANPRIALILLDVVMETEDAGLRLVHQIRNEMHNSLVRIVLRTGQPGRPGAAGDPRLRHQRLQDQDRADGAEALHHRHRLPALLRDPLRHRQEPAGARQDTGGAGISIICTRCGNLPPAYSSRSAPFSTWAPKAPSVPNAGPARRSWRSWRPPATMNPC